MLPVSARWSHRSRRGDEKYAGKTEVAGTTEVACPSAVLENDGVIARRVGKLLE
jgi:hypothetical protein